MLNITVKNLLNELPKNEVIYYCANPGNAGDALIACGAFKLFQEADLNIEIIDLENFDASGKILIYAGGGNLVGIYPEARLFFSRYHKEAKLLILLPHTVDKNEDLLSELGENVVLFAREEVSYFHMKQHVTSAKVYLDHDMALHVIAEEVMSDLTHGLIYTVFLKILYKLTKNSKFTHLPRPKIMLENTVFELFSFFKVNSEIGNFFRLDVERALKKTPQGNADLSTIYQYGTHHNAVTLYTAKRLLVYINRFSKIRTDRLHICIAAALLGKEVEFYPNSYFKCQAVYEYSLKDKFPNVHWLPVES